MKLKNKLNIMSFLKNQHQVESFSKTEDQLYTEMYSHWRIYSYFGKGKEKEKARKKAKEAEKNRILMESLMRAYDDDYFLYKFLSNIFLLLFLIAQLIQCIGLFPSKAVASP